MRGLSLPFNLAVLVTDAFGAATWTGSCSGDVVKEQTHVDSLARPEASLPLAAEVYVAVRSAVCNCKSTLFNPEGIALAVAFLQCVNQDLDISSALTETGEGCYTTDIGTSDELEVKGRHDTMSILQIYWLLPHHL